MACRVLPTLSSGYFIISLGRTSKLAIHTSFMTPSLFPLPGLPFLHLLHLTDSYLIFRTQLKKDVLCEAFSMAPPWRVPSNLLLLSWLYGRCIHSSILELLVLLMYLSPCEKEPSPIFSSLFYIEAWEIFNKWRNEDMKQITWIRGKLSWSPCKKKESRKHLFFQTWTASERLWDHWGGREDKILCDSESYTSLEH